MAMATDTTRIIAITPPRVGDLGGKAAHDLGDGSVPVSPQSGHPAVAFATALLLPPTSPRPTVGPLCGLTPPGNAASRFAFRSPIAPVLLGALLLLWPAALNGYPLVFSDTGTYLSQAIQHYLGWDRPIFYSLFLLPLHLTLTTWPAIAAQALLVAHTLHLLRRALLPAVSAWWLVPLLGALSLATPLPWLASQLMPDLFTGLLVVALGLLVFVPGSLSRGEQLWLIGFSAFMIAAHQSHVPLVLLLAPLLLALRWWLGPEPAAPDARVHNTPGRNPHTNNGHAPSAHAGNLPCADVSSGTVPCAAAPSTIASSATAAHQPRSRDTLWLATGRLLAPPLLACLALISTNLAGHHRASLAPFSNVFLLARVIYDGPGMRTLVRECPRAHWRLCPYVGQFPLTADEFLWQPDSPINRAGGPKLVSAEAGAIIASAIEAEPVAELRAVFGNATRQLAQFATGDGLGAWPRTVTPWIVRDFPSTEAATYLASRQSNGSLLVPGWLLMLHCIVALIGVVTCCSLLPVLLRRRHRFAGFLVLLLLALPINALITGGLSGPHDRYQSRVMWLPPLFAVLIIPGLMFPGLLSPRRALPGSPVPGSGVPGSAVPGFAVRELQLRRRKTLRPNLCGLETLQSATRPLSIQRSSNWLIRPTPRSHRHGWPPGQVPEAKA